MPLPKKRKSESRGEFVTRCYTNDKMINEYPRNKQRMGVCLNLASRDEKTKVGIRGGNQKFETYDDYPQSVSDAASRGIRLNEKVKNKCATQTGKIRAQQLSQGKKISFETIKRMYSYLSRAQSFYNPQDTEACGTISFLLWGGLPALKWSERKIKQIEKEKEK